MALNNLYELRCRYTREVARLHKSAEKDKPFEATRKIIWENYSQAADEVFKREARKALLMATVVAAAGTIFAAKGDMLDGAIAVTTAGIIYMSGRIRLSRLRYLKNYLKYEKQEHCSYGPGDKKVYQKAEKKMEAYVREIKLQAFLKKLVPGGPTAG